MLNKIGNVNADWTVAEKKPKNDIKGKKTKEDIEEEMEKDKREGQSAVKNNRYIKFLTAVLEKKCKKCDSLKPPGSHHCSTCEACVARMDHHCPWVNNCVGFYNQKFFL